MFLMFLNLFLLYLEIQLLFGGAFLSPNRLSLPLYLSQPTTLYSCLKPILGSHLHITPPPARSANKEFFPSDMVIPSNPMDDRVGVVSTVDAQSKCCQVAWFTSEQRTNPAIPWAPSLVESITVYDISHMQSFEPCIGDLVLWAGWSTSSSGGSVGGGSSGNAGGTKREGGQHRTAYIGVLKQIDDK
jgi:hypothetical protein